MNSIITDRTVKNKASRSKEVLWAIALFLVGMLSFLILGFTVRFIMSFLY